MLGEVVADGRPYRKAARYYRVRPPYSAELRPWLSGHLGWNGTGRLLDVGCGPGVVALELAPCFAEVVGLDPEEEMLVGAREASAAQTTNTRWVRGRAEDLPALGLGHFGAVTLAQSFHRTDREVVTEIVYDMLEPGGAMVLIHHDAARGLEPVTPAPSGGPPHPLVPHAVIRSVLARYLPRGGSTPGPEPERHEALLARTRFGPPERVVLPGRADLVRTVDEVIDAYLGTAFASPDRFGDRFNAFRAELAAELRERTDSGKFWQWPGDTELLIGRTSD